VKSGVGIDISNGAVTVAVVRGAAVETFESRPIVPREDERPKDAAARELREIFRTHELAGYTSAASLEARECILRELVVPFATEDKIRRMIRFEAENYLHACAIEDVIVDFFKVDTLDGKSGILLTAARKDVVRDRLALFQGGGVDPEILDLDVMALYSAFKTGPQWKAEGTALVVDIGTDTVRMLLVVNGMLRKVRAFRVRAGDLLASGRRLPAPEETPGAAPGESLLGELEERFAAIDRELAQAGGAPQGAGDVPIAIVSEDDFAALRDAEGGDAPSAAASPAGGDGGSALFDRILSEARRTFASTLYGRGLDAVLLCGPGSTLPEACEFFRKSFGADAHRLDLEAMFEKLEDRNVAAQAQTGGAVALGLALRAAGGTADGLDFRKDEFRYEKRFAKLRIPLLVAGALLFGSLFLNVLFLKQTTERYAATYDDVRTASVGLVRTTFNLADSQRLPYRLAAYVDSEAQRLEQLFKGGSGIPEYLVFLDLAADVSEAVKKAEVPNLVMMKIELKTEIQKRGVGAGSIAFLSDEATAVDRVREAILRHSQYVDALKPTTRPHRASQRVECILDLEFKESVINKTSGTAGKGKSLLGPPRLTPKRK
jgi:Tfp pilus assembly PilM family ATPase